MEAEWADAALRLDIPARTLGMGGCDAEGKKNNVLVYCINLFWIVNIIALNSTSLE